jgi:hypothetical protein
LKADQKNKGSPNGYDSDQGKTQRAGQTKLNDVAASHGSDRKNTEESEGQRETDEGGTYTGDPNDRPEISKGAGNKKGSSSQPAPHDPTSRNARDDI